ncbi:MAG: hypothetical protein LBC49_01600 [Bacteroidales bacterium]|jgi:hypothetical protein|nr:hypothetical protein [Bacteroidales bacterium]
MKRYNVILFCCAALLFPNALNLNAQSTIDKNLTKIISQVARRTAKKIVEEKGADSARVYAGCLHTATLWNPKTDGDELEYEKFCIDNFVNDTAMRASLYNAISEYSRSIFGHQKAMEYELLTMRDKGGRGQNWFDNAYMQYSPVRYYTDNFYENKLAFAIALNFPYVDWKEKERVGGSYQQWKYYRLGDMFISRQPYEIGGEVIEAEIAMRRYAFEYDVQKIEGYRYLLAFMQAQLKSDNYLRDNFLVRTLDKKYEISLGDMKKMLEDFLKSKEVKQVCKSLQDKLGRNLTVEDIYTQEEDEVKYPYISSSALTLDMPRLLKNAGFSEFSIETIMQNISIEPTTEAGTCYYDALKNSKGHLLVNIDDTGVSSASFRKAIYDFGSLVSTMIAAGVISDGATKRADYFMGNVPNDYFAGGLGIYILEKNNGISPLRNLSMMLRAGMALTEIYIWEAWSGNTSITAAVLKDEAKRIAQDIWNKYFYGYFGAKNNSLLVENNAMFIYPLMLPADAVGNITEVRVRDVIANAALNAGISSLDSAAVSAADASGTTSSTAASDKFFSELYRIYSIGKLTPALWFENAAASDASYKRSPKTMTPPLRGSQ